MADDILTLADKLWRGETSLEGHHPVSGQNLGDIAEVADGAAFVPSFANVAAFATERGAGARRHGSAPFWPGRVHEQVRSWTPDAAAHRGVHARPHRPRLRRAACSRRSRGQRLAAPQRARPRGDAGPLRPLHPDRRLQRGHQPAAVPVRGGLRWPTDVPLPRRDLPRRRSTCRSGRRRLRAAPRRGETDDHTWVWFPSREVAVHRRPVHLGVAQRRQPAEGAALPAGVGRRRCGRWPVARRRGAAARATGCRSSAPTGCAQALADTADAPRVAGRADARADERGRPARRHRPHGPRRRRTCSSGRTCGRCTTSPSSSSATSGGCTAAGTTATPPT